MKKIDYLKRALLFLGIGAISFGARDVISSNIDATPVQNTSIHEQANTTTTYDDIMDRYGVTFNTTQTTTTSTTTTTTTATEQTTTTSPTSIAKTEATTTTKPTTTTQTEKTTTTNTTTTTTTKPTYHYAVKDFNSTEKNIINNALCSMQSLNSFGDFSSIQVPDQFEQLHKMVFYILDNKVCNGSDYKYNNVLAYKGCGYDWENYSKWFLMNYGIVLDADVYFYNNDYDHVDLVISENTLTEQIKKMQQDYKGFLNFAQKTIKKLGINEKTTQIDALWKIHNYIIDNYSYDKTLKSAWLDTMLASSKGTCNGYALLLKLLARECGIDCNMFVCKDNKNSIRHAANLITFHDGKNTAQFVIDSTLADNKKDNTYMFGSSVSSAIKTYVNKLDYNNFDIVDYDNYASYCAYALGNQSPICSYKYDNNDISMVEPLDLE